MYVILHDVNVTERMSCLTDIYSNSLHFIPGWTYNENNKINSHYALLMLNSLNNVIDVNKIIKLYLSQNIFKYF